MNYILIVEDDKTLNKGIELALTGTDYTFYNAYSIAEAKDIMNGNEISLIILDINLPDGNGINLCKDIRTYSNVPIIFLTANKEEIDIVTGFYAGGDDYVTKPFSLMVLRARVMSALKHTQTIKNTIYITKDLRFHFDFLDMQFIKEGVEIVLSKTEQKLLKILVTNKGITLSRDRLIDAIWSDSSEYVDETALTVTISRLRNKLEDTPSKPEQIKTIYGLGYMWYEE